MLEMCSPVILGVTTIHVVGEANTYIHFKSMQGGPTQNQNDWFQLIQRAFGTQLIPGHAEAAERKKC